MNSRKDFFFKKIEHFNKSFISLDKCSAQLFIEELLGLLFPHYKSEKFPQIQDLTSYYNGLESKLAILISPLRGQLKDNPIKISKKFFNNIANIYDLLLLDAKAMYEGDPAATSVDEVIITYPGFFAISVHRLAHSLHKLGVPILPRLWSEYAHQKTGVDIHPGAKIGKSFCIDHATGVVIGETTIIGNNVKIYQGVTLGALSVSKDSCKQKRHPTIKNNVIIYANATILGGETIVGSNTIIGGNVWVTKSIPNNSLVVNESNIKIRTETQKK